MRRRQLKTREGCVSLMLCWSAGKAAPLAMALDLRCGKVRRARVGALGIKNTLMWKRVSGQTCVVCAFCVCHSSFLPHCSDFFAWGQAFSALRVTIGPEWAVSLAWQTGAARGERTKGYTWLISNWAQL